MSEMCDILLVLNKIIFEWDCSIEGKLCFTWFIANLYIQCCVYKLFSVFFMKNMQCLKKIQAIENESFFTSLLSAVEYYSAKLQKCFMYLFNDLFK